MSDPNSLENEFLNKITKIIEEHISDEHFSVAELARETGMSRSSLHRKVKSYTKSSVVLFISHIRLKHALDMLQHTSYTVSEVAYKVGFNSPSYFIKCFHDYYGYSPGEVGNRKEESISAPVQSSKKKFVAIIASLFFVVIVVLILFVVAKPFSSKHNELEKSIAVLPFKNLSNDSTNIYFIDGLREDILIKLGNISDLLVISSTSADKYRNTELTTKEIAKQLNVSYILEGGGQKTGNMVKLHAQLIVGETDAHKWADDYTREINDENIYDIQKEVALAVAEEINAKITPVEKERIEKRPTNNLVAYDYYLKGSELLNIVGTENLKEAIIFFEKSLKHDNEFALAYAELANTYSYLDRQTNKSYSTEININADKALLYDSQLDKSLIAKASFYLIQEEYKLSITYLEKALQYNPNSYLAIQSLCNIYAWRRPDTEKFIEYALRAVKLDISTNDSIDKSSDYATLSSAFREAGFFKEAELYINKALEIAPDNFAVVIAKGILLIDMSEHYQQADMSENYQQAIKLYTEAYSRDSTNAAIIRVLFSATYENRDFASAYKYGKKFIEIQEANNGLIWGGFNGVFGYVLSKIGKDKESEEYFRKFRDYAVTNKSINNYRGLTRVYALEGDSESAIEQMRIYSEKNNPYWIIRIFKVDPVYDNIRNLPEFKEILSEMETKFWANHERIKANLEEKGLL